MSKRKPKQWPHEAKMIVSIEPCGCDHEHEYDDFTLHGYTNDGTLQVGLTTSEQTTADDVLEWMDEQVEELASGHPDAPYMSQKADAVRAQIEAAHEAHKRGDVERAIIASAKAGAMVQWMFASVGYDLAAREQQRNRDRSAGGAMRHDPEESQAVRQHRQAVVNEIMDVNPRISHKSACQIAARRLGDGISPETIRKSTINPRKAGK